MKQHADRILPDGCCHLIEHIETGKFVFDYRVFAAICLQRNTLSKLCHVIQMRHPLFVDDFQEYDTLDLTEMFRLRKLCFLRFVYLGSLFLDSLFELIQFSGLFLFLGQHNRFHRNNRDQQLI